MVNLRLPKLDATTPQGQIKQLNSYLFQLVGDLQMSLEQQEKEISELRQLLQQKTQ